MRAVMRRLAASGELQGDELLALQARGRLLRRRRPAAPADTPWDDAVDRAAGVGPGAGRPRAAARIVGAVPFHSLSEELCGFREQIAPGAFAATVAQGGRFGAIRAVWQHAEPMVLGSTADGSLRLRETADGLLVALEPPDTPGVGDLLRRIAAGDVAGVSFSFAWRADAWEIGRGAIIRTLLDVELVHVAPVQRPAYPASWVAVVSRVGQVDERWHEREGRQRRLEREVQSP